MNFARELVMKLQRLLRRRSGLQDPYAYVTAGLKRGPSGRSSAIAPEEPQPKRLLNLFGRRVNG